MVPSWSARGRSICKEQYFCLFSKCNISIFVPAWYLNICTRLGLSEAREQKAFIHIFTSSAEFIKVGVLGSPHFSLTFFFFEGVFHIQINYSMSVSSAAHTFFELFGGGMLSTFRYTTHTYVGVLGSPHFSLDFFWKKSMFSKFRYPNYIFEWVTVPYL